eukprot:CAMPEP_0116856958 /NCGR_PEP_ID=MMETSP0418-20121206/20243_1 /TAXON_ID=1158023 /ORGANISM="Astrosyne radiata, Strain 13vi08-1A" /LENGTH=45 /DNA_ID= /DNA_START= /DNA_END= /DNA_ORIENTATION=
MAFLGEAPPPPNLGMVALGAGSAVPWDVDGVAAVPSPVSTTTHRE